MSNQDHQPINESRYKDIKDKAYYAKIANEYFERHEQPIQNFSTKIESKWLEQEIGRNERVLLVGVGGGREIEPLLNIGTKITAIDYSPEMVNIGRYYWKDQDIEWYVQDAHDLKDYEGIFDSVVCLAAINYFINPELAIKSMVASLRPGGKIIVSSINKDHITERDYTPRKGYNRVLFNAKGLTELLSREGVSIKSVRGIRIFVDTLPILWNKPKANHLQKFIMRLALLLERFILKLTPPVQAKFIWIIGEKC